MATAAKRRTVKNFKTAADQVRELNERVIEASSDAGAASLKVYGRLLQRLAESQEQADKHGREWLMAFGRAQTKFLRDLSDALPASARKEFGLDPEPKRAAKSPAKNIGSPKKNGGLPIANYDKLTAKQVEGRLKRLSNPELRKVSTYETKHKNRATVLKRIETLRAA